MKKEKCLFSAAVIAIVALLVIAVIGAYPVYNYMFPMAEPIDCPDMESITSITLIQDNNTFVTVETTDSGDFLHNISNAEPTRIWSVNDYPVEKLTATAGSEQNSSTEGPARFALDGNPVEKSYYTMEIDTSERKYRYFIYEENSQVYIESPYEGVYKTNQQILDLVAKQFKD